MKEPACFALCFQTINNTELTKKKAACVTGLLCGNWVTCLFGHGVDGRATKT